MKKRPVALVVGDAMLDVWMRGAVERRSPEADCPVLRETETTFAPGGAANVAANLAEMGCETYLACGRYDDSSDAILLTFLQAADVRVWRRRHERPGTTVKTRFVDQRGAHLLRVDHERWQEGWDAVDAQHALAILREGMVDVVVLSDYAKGFVTAECKRALVAACAEVGVPLLVDTKDVWAPELRGAFLVKPNESEMGKRAPIELLVGQQLSAVLCTRGDSGMTLLTRYGDGGAHGYDAECAEPVDVSGAGDAVLAATAAGYARGWPLELAVQQASVAAGAAVALPGTARVPLVEPARSSQRSIAWRGTVGMANGCFDLLHEGHEQLLLAASARCNHLIVAINDDASVRRLKGAERPAQPVAARVAAVRALLPRATVLVFCGDPSEIVRVYGVNVIFKGGEYGDKPVAGSEYARVELIKMVAGVSTTAKMREQESAACT